MGEFFMSTHFLARLVGHVINIHCSNMYYYINIVDFKSAAEDASKSGDESEVSNNNIINITEEHFNDVHKQQLAQSIDGFKATCI